MNENTLLCFLRDLKGGLLKTHYVWYAWTPGASCSKVGWLFLRFRLLWFPNSTRCLISTQYKSLEWSYLTNDKRRQIQLITEKTGLPVVKCHRRLINLHFPPEIYRYPAMAGIFNWQRTTKFGFPKPSSRQEKKHTWNLSFGNGFNKHHSKYLLSEI